MKRGQREDLEIARAVIEGGSLIGLSIMYGVSPASARFRYSRTIAAIAKRAGVPVPTIPQARAAAAVWRERIDNEGKQHGNT